MTATALKLHPVLDSSDRQIGFEALVNQYSADLFRYAYWLARERSVAEDVVQETFLRAWRSFDKLRDAGAVKAWLFTIVRREHARLYERYRPPLEELNPEIVPEHIEDGSDVETWLLRKHIAELAAEYREPLVLQIIGGFSCEEIGAMLGLSRGAVMTRVFRAKQKLRVKLTDDASLSAVRD